MAVLFRPLFPVDHSAWVPALRDALHDFDLRVAPETGNPAEIEYIIGWKPYKGDKTQWPNLKAMLSLGAGVNLFMGHPEYPDHIPLVRMIDPDLAQGMMEYVVSYVLRFHRRHDHMRAMAQTLPPWSPGMPVFARDRVVGIMGLGEMGMACATALKALGFHVRGWTRTQRREDGIETFHGVDGLKPFLTGCDILVCLLPLTAQTRGILNRDVFLNLPRGACVINAGRGAHTVDADLIEALESGHLDQAAFDVFNTEPLPLDHPFWQISNLHITPHIASITNPSSGARHLKAAITAISQGETPPGLVMTDRGY